MKPSPFLELSAGHSRAKMFLHFFLSGSRSILTTRFFFSILLDLTLSGRNYSFSTPFPSGYNGLSETFFFWTMTWSDEVRCFSHLQSHVVSHLSLSILLFSRTRDVDNNVLSKFFDIHGPQYLLRNSCFLVGLVVFCFVFAAMHTAFC